ncbi:MAG: hypothetical protein ACJ780_10265 [Solirubrobacteraceae bacterium]|jgi:hypothetical protein
MPSIYEQYERPLAGHTVTTAHPLPRSEQIVGHVLAISGEDYVEVLWLSTTRGAFTCIESLGDVEWCHTEAPGNYEPRYLAVTIAAVAD